MQSRKRPSKPKAGGANTSRPAQNADKTRATSTPYVVLARKYRPRTFDDLIGQDAMVRTLKNAFELGRIAQAYMLTGVRGIGKTTTARILARALNYSLPGKDVGPTLDMREEGEHCQAIMESRHVDVIEMDAASHTGIDDIREITEAVRYRPAYARYKVFIIDEVHMLSKSAFNGLLKTLEEPPEHAKFIFATTEVRKVPVTVLSRCQRFDLRRVESGKLVAHFRDIVKREGRKIEDDAVMLIARACEGSVRDGLSLLDQALAHAEGVVTAADVRAILGLADGARIFDLLECVFTGAAADALARLEALYADGAEPERIVAELANAVHVITRIAVAGEAGAVTAALGETERERAKALAVKLNIAALSRAWQMLLKGLDEVMKAPVPLAAAEMVLIRMCHVADLPPPDKVIRGLIGGTGDGGQPQTNQEHSTNESLTQDVPVLSSPEQQARKFWQSERAEAASQRPAAMTGMLVQPDELEGPMPPRLENLADVAALAGSKRDIKLKIALEEYVRLVRFRQGHIELQPLADAPANLANELGRKLTAWTGERWLVSVSDAHGEKTLGEQRREADARMRAEIERHPIVQEVFRHFPDAEITGISELSSTGKDGADAPPPAASSEDRNEKPDEYDEAGQRTAKQNGRDAGGD